MTVRAASPVSTAWKQEPGQEHRWLRYPVTEWLCIGLAAPLLLFPGRLALVGLVLVAASWAIRRVATGRWMVASAANRPLLVLLAALLASLVPSVRLDYSAPKFWGIVLGMAVFCACLNTCRTARARQLASLVLVVGGAAVCGVAALSMGDPNGKLFSAHGLYELLPRAVGSVQSSTIAIAGINPNEIGGVVALLVPIALALSLVSEWRERVAARLCTLVLLGILVLTQSRSAILGVAVALVAGAWWVARPRARALLTGLVLVGAIALLTLSWARHGAPGGSSLERLSAGSTGPESHLTLAGRDELWPVSLTMLLDMPFTGIGLNSFPVLLAQYYPTAFFGEEEIVAHAHNLFLHTALDLGVFGLAAFLLIVAVAVRGGLAAVRLGRERPLAVGLLLALLAHGVYSLTDAVVLGAKPSAALWAVLGLLATFDAREPAHAGGVEPAGASSVAASSPRSVRSAHRQVLNTVGRVGLGMVILAVVAAPLAVNAARIILHRPDTASRLDDPIVGRTLDTSNAVASTLAWGPYGARLLALEARVAHVRGDVDGELALLAAAVQAAPWDAASAQQLGGMRLVRGDLDGAVAAWGVSKTTETLLVRARAAPPEVALVLYSYAEQVDPTDWRGYVGEIEVYWQSSRMQAAAAPLAQALRVRRLGALTSSNAAPEQLGAPQGGDPSTDPALAVAARLRDPSAPLPASFTTPLSEVDAYLFGRASRLLWNRGDPLGALFAAQAAMVAEPVEYHWEWVAGVAERLGRPPLAGTPLERESSER